MFGSTSLAIVLQILSCAIARTAVDTSTVTFALKGKMQ